MIIDADLPFEVSVDGKTVKHQESVNSFNERVVSLDVKPNSETLFISGSVLQTTATPITQEPSLSKGYEIICEGKVWVESLKGKLACTFPSTAKQLVERGWGTILE
jgi:hypothetical protein